MLSPIERSPCYLSRILALKEEGLGLSALKAEDFAIAANEEFALLVLTVNRYSPHTLRDSTGPGF